MDIQAVLVNTYNPNPELRHQAEENLAVFLVQPGALCALLSLSNNHSNHRDLRQAASLVIKNKAHEFFDPTRNFPISEAEKEAVKQLLLQSLWVETDNSIRGIFAEVVRSISEYDYPDRWPNLLPDILTNVGSGDILRMFNALLSLRKLVKRLEFKHKEQRIPLNDIIQRTFPTLQGLMKSILDNNTIEAAMVLKVCLKIFWSCTNYALPTVTNVDVNLWFQMLTHLLNKPLPEAGSGQEPAGQPTSKEEREAWPWWKLKKWTSRIITHFIQRYGNPSYAGEENLAFAEYFKNYTSKILLAPVMNTLALRTNGLFVTDIVFRSCIAYVNSAVEMSVPYKSIKPHLDFILFKIVFPSLCLTDGEIELFDSDPIEFVRQVHTTVEDWIDVRLAAVTLLQTLGRYRLKDTLPKFLPFIQGMLNEHMQAVTSGSPVDYRRKEGCLVALSSISNILLEKSQYSQSLEPLIVAHVIPEFNSPIGFLRCRACLFMESFYECKWSNPATVQAVLNGLLTSLRDPQLPVQTAAAITLRLYLSEPSARDLVIPILPDIAKEYFRIMSEVENDVILSALQTIVLEFGDEVAGMSTMLVSELLGAFSYYSKQAGEDDEAAFSASQCLDTISAVLEASKDRPEQIREIERLILPLIHGLITEESVEYIDNICDIMGYLTYYTPAMGPELYTIFGYLLDILQSWAADYIVEMSPSIFNFIAQNPAQFLAGSFNSKPYIDILCGIIQRNMKETNNREIKAAAALATCLIECCMGQIDSYIPPILTLMFDALKATKSKSTSIKLLEVAMAIIYYNTPLALSLFAAAPAAADDLFATLFARLNDMEDITTQRLVVVSFSSLLAAPTTSLPPIVRTNLQSMFIQILRELELIKEEEEREKEAEEQRDGDDDGDMDDFAEMEEDGSDADEEEDEEEETAGKGADDKKKMGRLAALNIPDEGYDEDEDCVNAEDEEYLKALAELDNKNLKRTVYRDGARVYEGEPDSDDDDDDDYEGATYTSPVDAMDIVGHFKQALNAASAREPTVFVQLQQSLGDEDKERLRSVLEHVPA